MSELSYLEGIFTFQEKMIERYVQTYPTKYDFISECVDLLIEPGISEDVWDTQLTLSERFLFNLFNSDSLSTLINAIRLSLQGCDTDAHALMRVVLENLTVFEYINRKGLFDQAHHELLEKAKSGKKSTRFSYDTALKELEIDDRRKRLWGALSSIGSHMTPSRLLRAQYGDVDNKRLKAGVSIDNPRVKVTLAELASLALFFVIVIDDFLNPSSGNRVLSFHERRIELERAFDEI